MSEILIWILLTLVSPASGEQYEDGSFRYWMTDEVAIVGCLPEQGCGYLYNPEADTFEYAGPIIAVSKTPNPYR